MRAPLIGLVIVLAPGCGLVLDLDPPDPPGVDAAPAQDGGERDAGRDGGRMDASIDAGRPRPDAGRLDGGAVDAGRTGMDAAMDAGRDAGRDGAIRDGALECSVSADAGLGNCSSSRECPADAYCQREASCYGRGICTARPATCTGGLEPVCGCDWHTYGSPCLAAQAGVSIQSTGACPPTVSIDVCALPSPSGCDPGGCRFCFDNADCGATLAPICVASSCESRAPGLCAFSIGAGRCYDQRQCETGEICRGARTDVCPPSSGLCEEP